MFFLVKIKGFVDKREMETRGRKKLTAEAKKLQGTHRKDRDSHSPVADMKMPNAPSWLSADEKKVWKRLAPILNKSGVLSNGDAESFGLFCFWMNKFIQLKTNEALDVHVLTKCSAEIDRIGAKFGYTPADRASLKIEKPEKADPIEKLIKRRNLKIG